MARVIRVIEPKARGGQWDVVVVEGGESILIRSCPNRRSAMSWAAVERAKNPYAVALGSLGGSVSTTAKANASRANGAKGGRPRKVAR